MNNHFCLLDSQITATFKNNAMDVLQFIKQADERLYAAKRRSDSKLRVLEEQYRLLKVSTAAP